MRHAARRGHPARAIVAGWRKLVHSVPVEAVVPPSAETGGARAPAPAASEFVPTCAEQPASLFALKGELVTRESGEPVCRVARDIKWHSLPSPEDLTAWLIPRPEFGSKNDAAPGRRWWNGDGLIFDLHFERGWGTMTEP